MSDKPIKIGRDIDSYEEEVPTPAEKEMINKIQEKLALMSELGHTELITETRLPENVIKRLSMEGYRITKDSEKSWSIKYCPITVTHWEGEATTKKNKIQLATTYGTMRADISKEKALVFDMRKWKDRLRNTADTEFAAKMTAELSKVMANVASAVARGESFCEFENKRLYPDVWHHVTDMDLLLIELPGNRIHITWEDKYMDKIERMGGERPITRTEPIIDNFIINADEAASISKHSKRPQILKKEDSDSNMDNEIFWSIMNHIILWAKLGHESTDEMYYDMTAEIATKLESYGFIVETNPVIVHWGEVTVVAELEQALASREVKEEALDGE